MGPEVQPAEYPYFVMIEIATGQSATVPIAFLTAKQVEDFLRCDFQRLVQETGVKGARIHVQRATTADYAKVLSEITACLQKAAAKAA